MSPTERALRSNYESSLSDSRRKEQHARGLLDEKGTTANVLMIVENQLICANAGDSRCVVAEEGKAKALSLDHKPTQKREKERIYKAGHTVNYEGRIDGNLNLSRAIGDMWAKKNQKLPLEQQAVTALPDVKTHQLTEKTDFVIMGCDGVWELKNRQQMVDFVYK